MPLRRAAARLGSDRAWNVASAVLLFAVAVLMAATVRDYGITADEGVQQRYGRRLVRWYATLGEDRSAAERNNLYLYGGAFELAAQALEAVSPLEVYSSRHVANAAFGFVGIVAAWGLARGLAGPAAGFGSALCLTLTPGYYGHAFANPKDVPFAALYVAASWAILGAARDRLRPWSWRVLLAGGLVGLAAGVRVSGIFLVAFAALLWAAVEWGDPRAGMARPRALVRLALSMVAVLIVAWAVMLSCWPWAQLSPLANPVHALRAFSEFQGNPVLFDGRTVASTELPRTYVPKLFALTLPESYLVALVLGIAGTVTGGRRALARRPGRAVRVLWLAMLAVLPLAWAIARRTPLYNGVRHLLFVVPILAVLAAAGVTGWARSRLRPAVRLAGVAAFAAALAVAGVDMVLLHPYQYVYFNRLIAGGLQSAAGRYETDYWSASYAEGIEFTCGHYPRATLHRPLLIGGNRLVPFAAYFGRGRCAAPFFAAVSPEQDPHVLLVAPGERGGLSLSARLLHVVQRANAPLLYVYELRRPD